MKKIILISFIVLALGSFAYAQMGAGMGMGCWAAGNTQITSASQAEDIIKSYLGTGNGTVSGSEAVELRRGTGYKVAVKDDAGNTSYYLVTPYGMARGPFSEEVANNFGQFGFGMRHGMGHGMGHGYGMMGNTEPTVTTIAQAEEVVKQAISNLKGYTITSTDELQVMRGTAYKVNVKDSAGNQLYYFVNPYGYARGPLADVAQNK